jgi:hypothetical protein
MNALTYKLAKLIANPDKIPPARWGILAGAVLEELERENPEDYRKFVSEAVPRGHGEVNDVPLCWATDEEIFKELGRRYGSFAIAYNLNKGDEEEGVSVRTCWHGSLSTAVGHAYRLWRHMSKLVNRQISDNMRKPNDDSDSNPRKD